MTWCTQEHVLAAQDYIQAKLSTKGYHRHHQHHHEASSWNCLLRLLMSHLSVHYHCMCYMSHSDCTWGQWCEIAHWTSVTKHTRYLHHVQLHIYYGCNEHWSKVFGQRTNNCNYYLAEYKHNMKKILSLNYCHGNFKSSVWNIRFHAVNHTVAESALYQAAL